MAGPKYVKNFQFPKEFGFSGSARDPSMISVKSHDRRKPMQKGGKTEREPKVEVEVELYAQGGPLRKGHMARSTPHQSAYESKPHAHLAKGGQVDARKVAREEIRKHESASPPRGHGVGKRSR